MKAATHNGTCQACGRVQAHTPAGIAKHGYRVAEFGFFVGTCPGSGNAPVEQEITLLEQIRASLLKQAATLAAKTLADVTEVTLTFTNFDAPIGHPNRRMDVTFTSEAELRAHPRVQLHQRWDDLRESKLNGWHSQGRAAAAHAETLAGIRDARHGKPLFKRAKAKREPTDVR